MRRFFVWSALAALVGLILAIGGFWAYQHFYARFQPVTVTRNQAVIQELLDEASWLSSGGGGEPGAPVCDDPAREQERRGDL